MPKNHLKSGIAAAVLVGMSSTASAQEVQPFIGSDVVSIGIVDSQVQKLDFDDPNVRIIDLTPDDPSKIFTREKVTDKFSHGDLVASSFVSEYRKIDPEARINIYAVSPFVKGADGKETLDIGILRQSLPKMANAGVRVAITAVGFESSKGGQAIFNQFRHNNINLLSAAPNDRYDRGIYPAATPGVISVATEMKNSAFASNPEYKSWVSFVGPPHHRSDHGSSSSSGSSYAVAHVGAYAAHIVHTNPKIAFDDLIREMRSTGSQIGGSYKGIPSLTYRIGGQETIESLRSMKRKTGPSLSQQMPDDIPEKISIVSSKGPSRDIGPQSMESMQKSYER